MGELNGNILVAEDDEDILIALRMLLKRHGARVHTEPNPENIPSRLNDVKYNVILLCMNFTQDTATGKEGFFWLEKILNLDPSAVVILITAYGDVEMAVRAIKAGAVDFVTKPWQNEKLIATVNSALKLSSSRAEVETLRSRQKMLIDDLSHGHQDILGFSSAMMKVFSVIEKVAGTDADVLILGENGTGKELVARAIHRQSRRKNEAFITVDVGSLTESLFESELFGYVKGAFTDAKQDRPGRFEAASGGSIFLDEIGNVSSYQQSKLLRVLESRHITRLGSNASRPIDVRLICATNMLLNKMVASGEFRQDLLYRINTVEIPLPPLRERKEDIGVLSEHFLAIYAKKYRRDKLRLPKSTIQRLERYHWPGNVRELRHAIERAVIMADGDRLEPADFFFAPSDSSDDVLRLDNLNLEDVERKVVLKAMKRYGGNILHAAKELGLTRPSLYRRIEKYGL